MPESSAFARYLAEALGTFVLVATVCANVLSGEAVWAGVSIGCSLAVMIYALGKTSGAHFNPAVSVACGLARKCPWKDVCCYVVSQIVGGLLAAIFSMLMFKGRGIVLKPVGEHTWWQAGVAELIYTAMLCFVVLNTATSKKHAGLNQFYGIAIGFVIVAGAYGAGNISMGCFNPAVALALDFGTAIVTASSPTWYSLLYTGFEVLGAFVAAALFFVVRPEDFRPGAADGSDAPPLYSKLVSEFLGTYILVLTVGLNVLTGSPAGAFSIASSLMCMIFALGSVSGAHFNPAVTVAVVASRRGACSVRDGAQYVAVQLAAGFLAAETYKALTGTGFATLKPVGSDWWQVCMAELVWTTVLAFVVLSVATVHAPLTHYFGFAIGMCVTVGGVAIGGISGGSLNPAVSLGIVASGELHNLWQFFPYAAIEVLAGGLAAALFYGTQPSEFEKASTAETSEFEKASTAEKASTPQTASTEAMEDGDRSPMRFAPRTALNEAMEEGNAGQTCV